MADAIADLGYCAAMCELESHLCPWERTELKRRASAYRREQLRLLSELTGAHSNHGQASSRIERLRGVYILGSQSDGSASGGAGNAETPVLGQASGVA